MSCYGSLASWYDELTGDVPYERFVELYEAEFKADGGNFELLLDLCCGTGTISCMLAQCGYDIIGVDASEEMLIQAREKAEEIGLSPLFLQQNAEELDLYGTVDAAICSLDGINYIPQSDLPDVFRRLGLFVRSGGLFIFDIRPDEWFRALDGQIFVDETEDVLCLWRADFYEDQNAIVYGMDIFSREGDVWLRDGEEHIEYAHTERALEELLNNAGFEILRIRRDYLGEGSGRVFITAKRKL